MNVESEEDTLQKLGIIWEMILLLILKMWGIKPKTVTTDISECQEDDKVIDDATYFGIGTMEMTTYDTVENEMTEHQVENEDTGGEMSFDK